jgi:transposase
VDESGFMMAPLVRRTWAPRGTTQIMFQHGRSHEKVSAIAALVVSKGRDNVRLFFRLHPDGNIKTSLILSFLRQLSRQLGKKTFLVVWDRLNAHRAKVPENELRRVRAPPPYAPGLNPVEYIWSYLKANPMANDPYSDTGTLAGAARRNGKAIQRREELLRSFLKHSPFFYVFYRTLFIQVSIMIEESPLPRTENQAGLFLKTAREIS